MPSVERRNIVKKVNHNIIIPVAESTGEHTING